MASNSDEAARANDWDDVADKKAHNEKAPGGMLASREGSGHQNSANDVPGQREKDKSAAGKLLDPVAGKAQKAASSEPGESGVSQKIKEGLKGAHPET